MKIGDKVCSVVFLYISSSQTLDDFETFSKNYEFDLGKNSFLIVTIGDFNA